VSGVVFWWWFPGVLQGVFWLVVIVAGVMLLSRELSHPRQRAGPTSALRLLEERYARGEITREDFLHRRSVLLGAPDGGQQPGPYGGQPASPGPTRGPADPTEPLPPAVPHEPDSRPTGE
jgi:putative membrane protein